MYTHRDGDHYAALRDAESALIISPLFKRAHQRRLKCLISLGMKGVANGLLTQYKSLFKDDNDFYTKLETEISKQDDGMLTQYF